MCKSSAQGGQRCSAHAQKKYDRAVAVMEAAAAKTISEPSRRHTDKFLAAEQAQHDAAVQYASTPQGREHFTRLRDAVPASDDQGTAETLNTIIVLGNRMREVNAEVGRQLAARNPVTRRTQAKKARSSATEKVQRAEFDCAYAAEHPGDWDGGTDNLKVTPEDPADAKRFRTPPGGYEGTLEDGRQAYVQHSAGAPGWPPVGQPAAYPSRAEWDGDESLNQGYTWDEYRALESDEA